MNELQQSSPKTRYSFAILRVLIVPLVIVAMHSVTRFMPWYFLLIVGAATLLGLSPWMTIPGLRFLSSLQGSDRQATWIVLVCMSVIGYLHNANVWTMENSRFGRPASISLWKTELILGISLAVPLLQWLIRVFRPGMGSINGRQFAREFALYVNFSGIAVVLWSGDAIVSVKLLITVLALASLAELTLYASG